MGPRAATTCWPWTWTLRPVPWLQGTAMVPCGLAWEDGSDVVASPRQILRRQLGRLAERGWSANAAPSWSSWCSVRPTSPPGTRPTATSSPQPLQRRLLHAWHRADRAAHPSHPQRHGGRGDGRRELQGRVPLRPARDQLSLRRRAAHRRRPRDLQERRQGGDGDQLHGEVRRARGQLVPHPLLAGRRRRAQRVCRRRGDVRVVPGRPARLPARPDGAGGAQHQLLQALRGGVVRTDDDRLGPG
jgi:hypothetical protein